MQHAYGFGCTIKTMDPPSYEVTLNYHYEKGNTTLLEQYILVHLCKTAKTVFEIGTFNGQTTLNIAKNNPDAHIYTLDVAQGAETAFSLSETEKKYTEKSIIGCHFRGTPEEERITQLIGDSATFDYSCSYCSN